MPTKISYNYLSSKNPLTVHLRSLVVKKNIEIDLPGREQNK